MYYISSIASPDYTTYKRFHRIILIILTINEALLGWLCVNTKVVYINIYIYCSQAARNQKCIFNDNNKTRRAKKSISPPHARIMYTIAPTWFACHLLLCSTELFCFSLLFTCLETDDVVSLKYRQCVQNKEFYRINSSGYWKSNKVYRQYLLHTVLLSVDYYYATTTVYGVLCDLLLYLSVTTRGHDGRPRVGSARRCAS